MPTEKDLAALHASLDSRIARSGAVNIHYYAIGAAMTVPARVRSLVALAMPHPGAIAAGMLANAEQRRSSDYVLFFQSPDAHLRYPPKRLGFWVQDELFAKYHRAAMDRSSLKAMVDYYRENFPRPPSFEGEADHPPVTVPTLVIHGQDDPYALPAGVRNTLRFRYGRSVGACHVAGRAFPASAQQRGGQQPARGLAEGAGLE